MSTALSGMIRGLLAAQVADVRTAVVRGVGVHDFAVEAGLGNAETITFADNRSGVENSDDKFIRSFPERQSPLFMNAPRWAGV